MAEVVRLGIADIVRRLHVNRISVWRMVKDGRFPAPHYILGNRKWFQSEVEEWERKEMATPPQTARVPPEPPQPKWSPERRAEQNAARRARRAAKKAGAK